MKLKYNLLVMAIVCLTAIFSCRKMDYAFKNLIKEGNVYLAKADSIKIGPGYNRVKFTWAKGSDGRVMKTRIYWNGRKDSVEIANLPDVNPSVIISDLAEGLQTFMFYTYDSSNNKSVGVEVSTKIYGRNYEKTLLTQPINDFIIGDQNSDVLFLLGSVDTSVVFNSEISFIDKNNVSRNIMIPNDNLSKVCPDFVVGGTYTIKTKYLPTKLAIDTFYASKTAVIAASEFDRYEMSTLNLGGITLNVPNAIVTDASGNIYISDANNHRIVRVEQSSGAASVWAGSTDAGYTDNVVRTSARFRNPWGMAFDNSGDLLVADNNNHSIRKIDATTGMVTTVAGSATVGNVDDYGVNARFNRPAGLVVNGDMLYVAEWGGNIVRKIDMADDYNVMSLAGAYSASEIPTASEGTGPTAKFSRPFGIEISPDKSMLYVHNWSTPALSRVNIAAKTVTVIGGASNTLNIGTTRGGSITDGKLMIVNYDNSTLSIWDPANPTRAARIIAGSTGKSGYTDGLGSSARLNKPIGIWYDVLKKQWYIAEEGNNRIRILKKKTT